MESLKNYSVLDGEKGDQVLHEKSCAVNLRLLQEGDDYREVIFGIKRGMIRAFNRKYSDYNEIQGISGPNIGIPLRIIAIRIRKKNGDFIDGLPEELSKNRRTKPILFMLNPKISVKSEKIYSIKSNCGSLMLKDPIKVCRHEHIEMVYWDLKGYMHLNGFDKPAAATIQHEIDHLNGLTILDRQVKTEENDYEG